MLAIGNWRWHGSYTYTLTDSNGVTTQYGPFLYGNAITHECPTGWSGGTGQTSKGVCWRKDKPAQPCDVCDARNRVPAVNNNTVFSSGLNQQQEVDYVNASRTLQFVRTYRSDEKKWTHNYEINAVNFNLRTASSKSNLCVKKKSEYNGKELCLAYLGTADPSTPRANNFGVRRGNGRVLYFGSDNDLLPAVDINDRVSYEIDTSAETNGISVYNAQTEATEYFGINDKIIKSVQANGDVIRFKYSTSDTPKDIAPEMNLLISVEDSFGSHLDFTYDINSNLATMKLPDGGVFTYQYTSGMLTSVTYPDGQSRNYVYGEAAKTGNSSQPFALTTIRDENGIQIAGFTYNSSGELVGNETAEGIAKNTVSYSSGVATVKDPVGATKRYSFSTYQGVSKLFYFTQPSPSGTGDVGTRLGYDVNGNINSVEAFDGTKTTYVYDLSRNLETSRTNAIGTTFARTTTTEWHPTFRNPTRIAEPKRLTVNTYDQFGNLSTTTRQATADQSGAQGFGAGLVGSPQTTTYTYNQHGQILTITGPRTDVNDTTTFTYDDAGNLTSIKDALGYVTSLSAYDANGRVGQITDPNGLITKFTYTSRGWLSSKTVGEEVSTFSYNSLGQLTQATAADNSTITYTYDAARRLTGISDSLGNSYTYTLDELGNRVSEQARDPVGLLTRQITRTFGSAGQVTQQTGGMQ